MASANIRERETKMRDVLDLWSRGRIGQREACRRTGLRDGTELLAYAAERGIPMPCPSNEEVERQAEVFADLLKRNGQCAADC